MAAHLGVTLGSGRPTLHGSAATPEVGSAAEEGVTLLGKIWEGNGSYRMVRGTLSSHCHVYGRCKEVCMLMNGPECIR